MKLPDIFISSFQLALNQYLQLDPETPARLAILSGKVIGIEFVQTEIRFYLMVMPESIRVLSEYDGVADACLVGTPLSLARMGIDEQPGDVLFSGDVEIRGDVEVGQKFRQILDSVDIDWEEQLSRLTGDVVAHQLGNTVRSTKGWMEKTLNILGLDLADYLKEESRLLPRREEVESFLNEIDALRSDVDRLEAHVRRLQSQLSGPKKQSKG